MKQSIFSAQKLSNLNVVAKGTKTTNEARPEVVAARAINKFTINNSAATMLDVKNGDNVVMFYIPGEEDLNAKFFIAKGTDKDAKVASNNKINGTGNLNFSYSALWSIMVQEKADALPLGERALVEAGIMKKFATQMGRPKADGSREMCYANLLPYQLAYEIELVADEEGAPIPVTVGDTTYERVFVLKNAIKRVAEEKKASTSVSKVEDVVIEDDDETFVENLL